MASRHFDPFCIVGLETAQRLLVGLVALWRDTALAAMPSQVGGVVPQTETAFVQTDSDTDWLIRAGYAARVAGPNVSGTAAWSPGNSHPPGPTGPLIITKAGDGVVREFLERLRSTVGENLFLGMSTDGRMRPHWDAQRRELRCGPLVVKEFHVPAPNQSLILTVFEEEGWPEQIDDPLPRKPGLNPKRRLHDTINSLNRNQQRPLLRFHGVGTGRAVRWEHRIAIIGESPSDRESGG